MKTRAVCFTLESRRLGLVSVTFAFDEHGQPTIVRVVAGITGVDFDNIRGHLKPCVTHCRQLIERAFPKPLPSAALVESQRRRKDRVALKVFKQP